MISAAFQPSNFCQYRPARDNIQYGCACEKGKGWGQRAIHPRAFVADIAFGACLACGSYGAGVDRGASIGQASCLALLHAEAGPGGGSTARSIHPRGRPDPLLVPDNGFLMTELNNHPSGCSSKCARQVPGASLATRTRPTPTRKSAWMPLETKNYSG